jgi:pyruvate formate-lyase/glycerol dehydratase family glycyl radical enzyme
MNKRVSTLREQSLAAIPTISAERALLVTDACQNLGLESSPVARAKVFRHFFLNKELCVNDGELIVGERGPAPKATPTFPELCCHSLEDLEILNNREKISFSVTEETRAAFRDKIIPFWKGKTMREKILAEMTSEWHTAYENGLFTEFMEQRAPGHTVLDNKIYLYGMTDFIEQLETSMDKLDFECDPRAYDKLNQLKAMKITAQTLIDFARRYSSLLADMASQEENDVRKQELLKMAEICSRVPANKPETMWEALQYYWFAHLGVISELNPWDAFNPGRLDQHLYPFYVNEISEGSLTEEEAKELLQCLWIKFNNQPAPPKVGVTAAESSTYTDFANINLGGVKSDGSDAVNQLSYLILEVIEEMRLLQPSSNIQLSAKNPDKFLRKCLRINRTGFGQPSIFNADTVVEEMLNMGKTIEDARTGGTSGCVETGAFGKESYILTGYLNLPKILELTLHNGVDPLSNAQIGTETGNPKDWRSFEDVKTAYAKQLQNIIDIKIFGNRIIERLFAQYLPVPFLSLITDDCIQNGIDYNAGGARYNTAYIQGVGLGSLTDSLSALNHHVFKEGTVTIDEMIDSLRKNFEDSRQLQLRLHNKTPRYGNDDDRADDLARWIFETFYSAVSGRPTTKGGTFQINMLPTTCHVYFGGKTGALPDGREAHKPFSEGISPVQATDRQGPTAVLKSASKIDHAKTGGTLLNQKFTPSLLAGEEGIRNLAGLVRSYFKLGGHHIQFNVVDAETLKKAKEHPEEYRDLIVRVAGYSDYFCDLSETLQDEIIARTEHQAF